MVSEILKIIPKLDGSALAKMERDLGSRLGRVAKKFGSQIGNLFKGGGIAGAALALIDKILNPLKEVQEAMDRTLSMSDDLATNAGQFNTTTGKLFKLTQLGKATGLGQDNLFQLMTKFQTAVAQAKANPNDDSVSSVRNFMDTEDTAEGFFQFIQSLQKMDKSTQVRVQEQIFGEKQILKMADFLQSDFPKLFQKIGLDKVTTEKLTTSIEKLANLNDLADTLTAQRETTDIIKKSGIITESMILAKNNAEKQALERENARIKGYENLQAITQTVDKIMTVLEEGLDQLGIFIKWMTPTINRLVEAVEKFSKGPVARGIMKFFGKGE